MFGVRVEADVQETIVGKRRKVLEASVMALVVLLAKVLKPIRKSRAVVFLRIYMILLLIRGILIFLINQLGNIHY